MLVASNIVKNGPGSKFLKTGDILIRINSKFIFNFIGLEDILDNSIGEDIEMEIDRAGESITYSIQVQDLYSIIPSSYVDFGGGVLHQLSYQHAISYHFPVEGVAVATPGYILGKEIDKRCIIKQIGSTKIDNLDCFIETIKTYPIGSFIPIKFLNLDSKHIERNCIIRLDFTWHSFTKTTKITQGNWKSEPISYSDDIYECPKLSAKFPTLKNPLANLISKSLVTVSFSVPYQFSGVSSSNYFGCWYYC